MSMLWAKKTFRLGGRLVRRGDRVRRSECTAAMVARGWVGIDATTSKPPPPAAAVSVAVAKEEKPPVEYEPPPPPKDPGRFDGRTRAELEEMAREAGVQGVEHLARKQDVIDAIVAMGG